MADAWNFVKRPFTEPKVTLNLDSHKAGSRKGPNGTGLSREKRAKHLTDEDLLDKHARAYSKAMKDTGNFYKSYNQTYIRAGKLLTRPHEGVVEEIATGRTLISAVETADGWRDSIYQHNRAYDYKRQLTARGLKPTVTGEKAGDDVLEGWNRKRNPTAKSMDKSLGNAQKIAKLKEKQDKDRTESDSQQFSGYSEPRYTYTTSGRDDYYDDDD